MSTGRVTMMIEDEGSDSFPVPVAALPAIVSRKGTEDSSSSDPGDERLDGGCLRIPSQTESVVTLYAAPVGSGSSSSVIVHSETAIQSSERKTVRFGTVTIFVHANILGDNPSVSAGPPLAIDWKALHSTTLSLDAYEEQNPGPRRTSGELLLPRMMRDDILRHEGYARSEMKEVIQEVLKIKSQRENSARDGQRFLGKMKRMLKGEK